MSIDGSRGGRKSMIGNALLVVLSFLILGTVSTAAQTRQFQNWIVGCDNTHICTAIAFAEPSKAVSEPGIPFIEIRHHSARGATPMIRLVEPGPPARTRGFATVAARLAVVPVGAEVAKGPSIYTPSFEGAGRLLFKDDHAWGILAALRSDQRITVSIGDKRNLRVPTQGLEAALAYIDSQQDLAGTPGALVNPQGSGSADYAHPKAPDAPTVEGAAFGEFTESRVLARTLPSVSGCSAAPSGRHAEGYPLQGAAMLLMRDCDTILGNARTAWFMMPNANARPVAFTWPGIEGEKRQGGSILSNAEVLPNTGMVRSIRYLDQSEDCGIAERWAWTKGGTFQLIERKEMPICRTAGDGHWIMTYRANFIMPN